jgi:cytochrome c biogenesis protein CcdA
MSPFWTSFFTHLKDCGRNTTLFVVTFSLLFVLVVIATICCGNNLPGYVVRALPGVGVFVVAWGAVAFIRMRARRRERLGRAPLSMDELQKARSKLVKARRD